jgi:hypothetical protein
VNRRTRTVVDTLLPSDTVLGRGALDAGFEAFLPRFESEAVPRARLGFRAGVWAASWVAPMLIGKLPPLGRHPRDVRERALEAMRRRPVLRQLIQLVKTVVSFSVGADPQIRTTIGYASTEEPP